MSAFAFVSRTRNFVAVIMSAIAVLAIATYITAPVYAKSSIASAYVAARHPVVSGVVKAPSKGDARKARVTLVFHDPSGQVIATFHISVDRYGRWHMKIPHGAAKVSVTIVDAGRVMTITEAIHAGHSLALTAVFPGRNTGLLPGLFPY